MLRTLLFVMVLVWLVLASAIAFVPIAAAGEPEGPQPKLGMLTATCDRDSAPRGADTLLRCEYVATNTSGRDWPEARMMYVPAADVTIPDRYFFFRYVLNGTEQTHAGTEITYSFGRIADGASATVQLDIIVRSDHEFGADVLLDAGGTEIHRAEQRWTVVDDAPEPALYGSLVPIWRDESGGVSPSDASFTLVVRNTLDEDLALITAEVFAPDYGITAGLDPQNRTSKSIITGALGPVMAGGYIQRELRVETRPRCTYASPAMIVNASRSGAQAVRAAILPDEGATLNCGTLETPSFPAAGQGPMPEGAATPLRPLPLAIATSGAVIALLGAAPLIRRLRRRR